jgi:hypothetical protein
MVENFAESPGMCSDCPGRALIKIPKRGLFSLREGKRKKIGSKCLRWRKGRRGLGRFHPAAWDPPARHGRTVRDNPADSPRGARTVRAPGADGPLKLPERPELHPCPTNHADGPGCPGGQSARSSRTVRLVEMDGPTSFLISA